jgi:hypothetical protein
LDQPDTILRLPLLHGGRRCTVVVPDLIPISIGTPVKNNIHEVELVKELGHRPRFLEHFTHVL